MTTNEELFALWAPPESQWSAWTKPVLFADMGKPLDSTDPPDVPRIENFPQASNTAAIVDVEGANSVLIGLALAKTGYRPVPLYNGGIGRGMLVNMRTIADYLCFGAPVLQQCTLSPQAPPVFLLNSDRLDNAIGAKSPGRYDNRWCVVPQDMPSAEYLNDAGIKCVALIAQRVMTDLCHVLCRYQDAGISILRTADIGIAPAPLTVSKPPLYRSALYRFQAYAGLRRNAAGGFGAVVPDPNSSGGFGA